MSLTTNPQVPIGAWIPSSGGGGGSGTVTSIVAGTGLSGGTITTTGTIALANPNTFERTVSLPGPRIVDNDLTNWIIMGHAGSISKVWAVAKTGPTGAGMIFDIQKSTNNGSSFTSIWSVTPANKLTIAAGGNNASQTSFDTATFNAGDIYRFDIDQVGSTIAGSDITINIVTN